VHSPNRLKYPEIREPGSSEWKRISWDSAFDRIAKLLKDDRDANFQKTNADGQTVNRWTSTGMLCASASSNETGYITHKAFRSLGMLVFDNQARV
jgi:formate dehydrogenase major subunit